MRRASPELASRGELGDVGRARRFDVGEGRELWRLPASDVPIAERLLRLSAHGVGGFVDGGEDDAGVWLVRAPPGESLADWLKHERDPPAALDVGIALGNLLAFAESESLFPGRLSPKVVALSGEGVELRADALVASLLGAAGQAASAADSASPRWIAPEQAAGAAWDNQANRYVLGLLLYRMLAGEHAFAGRGLRLGLEEQARRAPPPMPEARAAALPPGLQGFVLRMLDPDPRARPARARDIVQKLSEFRHPSAAAPVAKPRAAEPEPEPSQPAQRPIARAPARTKRLPAWLASLACLGAGGLVAWIILAGVRATPARPARTLIRPPVSAESTAAADCASCHPRQAGEWNRSVMAHAVKSPLFQALEILIEEQVGRDFDCPNGAGILRSADASSACRDRASGLPVTGSGGELWCVNCHSPGQNLSPRSLVWDGRSTDSGSRRPLVNLLGPAAMEGVSCAFCHQVEGPVRPGRGNYQGNPFWTSTRTGERFAMRPEDLKGLFGISNSGYALSSNQLLPGAVPESERVPGGAHARPSKSAAAYLRTSQFCGSCHDVRLFGSDAIGVRQGEHFKRLRNAYSEWVAYAEKERRAGRTPASCQDCHMSTFPGVCEPGPKAAREADTAADRACPPGTHFASRRPGDYPKGLSATNSGEPRAVRPHYFSGVDLPLTPEFSAELLDEAGVDVDGVPLGARARRDLLLSRSVQLELEPGSLRGASLELPVVFENVGAGHRVPAGFSQERELWLHLRVTDARGGLVYEVGRVDRDDEDLRDRTFLRVNTDDALRDGQGRPVGLFGADVADGPDVGRWSPNPSRGGTLFRGRGLVNFQNGFLRCVVCIGQIDSLGRCQPLPGQERARADRFGEGSFDPDSGECRSNLSGDEALFETYFPIGALDATRGAVKGPDAIIDTRSLPPGVPIRYVYQLDTRGRPGPFSVDARLLFRAFPPYLLRAFIDYERRQARAGKRPTGALIGPSVIARNSVVELVHVAQVVR